LSAHETEDGADLPDHVAAGATLRKVKDGLRAGAWTGVASGLVAISYGVLARPVLGGAATVASSVLIFAGSAQFAMLSVLSAGGSATAAVLAGVLLNLRFVPMGLALAPWVRGGHARRLATGWIMVDVSWAMAARAGGRFDVPFMVGVSFTNFPAWIAGTVIGVLAGSHIGNPQSLGLDALFPAFFLALLMAETRRSPRRRMVALAGALIALALTPVLPPGVPVLAAAGGALPGVKRR
jgi:4-azaleucine resistance transporter AzlC